MTTRGRSPVPVFSFHPESFHPEIVSISHQRFFHYRRGSRLLSASPLRANSESRHALPEPMTIPSRTPASRRALLRSRKRAQRERGARRGDAPGASNRVRQRNAVHCQETWLDKERKPHTRLIGTHLLRFPCLQWCQLSPVGQPRNPRFSRLTLRRFPPVKLLALRRISTQVLENFRFPEIPGAREAPREKRAAREGRSIVPFPGGGSTFDLETRLRHGHAGAW